MAESDADVSTEVEAFLRFYAGAFAGLDVDRLVAAHGLPCLFVTDEYALAITDPGELRAALSLVIEFYGSVGVATAAAEILDSRTLNDDLTHVLVRWRYADDGGHPLAESEHFYLLRRRDGDLRIHTAVSTDAERQLRALSDQLRGSPW